MTESSPGNGVPESPILIDFNPTTGVVHFSRRDGKYLQQQVSNPQPDSRIVRATHMLGLPHLVVTTSRGEDITVELPILSDTAPLRGRPVVYLDQQAWSKLSLARHEPERLLPAEEREAAQWLIDLVESSSVILPYSSGVLTETTHWSDNNRRYQLALTIATLSRGWQMLDPLAIRSQELEHVLAVDKEAWPLPQPWTLAPGAWAQLREPVSASGNDLPPDHALTVKAIVAALGAISAILDESPIPRSDQDGWAAHWGRLSTHVAETKKPKHLTELAVHAAIMGDARTELARAAVRVECTPDAFASWLKTTARQDVGRLPAIGLAREVTYLKVTNSTAKWESNDLTDIFYLVQACGYADATVGEKGFVTLVQQAESRLGRRVNAHKTLRALRGSGVLPDARSNPPTPAPAGASPQQKPSMR